MGSILDRYLSSFGQSLQELAASPGGPPTSSLQARGQRNLETSQARASFADQPVGDGAAPGGGGAGTFTELPMLPGETPEQNQAAYERSVGQSFETGDPTQIETAPAPTFEAPGLTEIDPSQIPARKGMNPEDVRTPEDLFAAASPEQIEGGIKALEGVLEEQGSSLDDAYENVTGGPPDTRLTREEKGTLLMQFDLLEPEL